MPVFSACGTLKILCIHAFIAHHIEASHIPDFESFYHLLSFPWHMSVWIHILILWNNIPQQLSLH